MGGERPPRVSAPRRSKGARRASGPPSERLVIGVLLGFFGLLAICVVGAIMWSAGRGSSAPPAVVDYEAYRASWESAMAKAGVEATFPVSPVYVEEVQASGLQSLSATFTADEVTALVVMYRFDYPVDGGFVSLIRPSVSFPSPGWVSVSGRLAYQGSSYAIQASAPASMHQGRLELDTGSAELVAEGFNVDGERRDQAMRMVGTYVEAFVEGAPRLRIERAEVVEGGVRVVGTAPKRLMNPAR